MGNAAIVEELPGSDELDVLYRLSASENGPEDEDEDGDDLDEDGRGRRGDAPPTICRQG